ncbi:MAG: hypothetical protein V2A55_02525 [Candidatus Jorgensenbacteria bacterium]
MTTTWDKAGSIVLGLLMSLFFRAPGAILILLIIFVYQRHTKKKVFFYCVRGVGLGFAIFVLAYLRQM